MESSKETPDNASEVSRPKKDGNAKKTSKGMKVAQWALDGLDKDLNEKKHDPALDEQDFLYFATTLAEGKGLSLDQIEKGQLDKWRVGYFRHRHTHLEDPAITRLYAAEIQGKKFLGKGTLVKKPKTTKPQ